MSLMEVLRELSSYTVPDINVRFVNREEETKVILDLLQRELTNIVVIFGPWGCGKTEFARAFTYAVERTLDDVVVMYVNPLEEKRLELGLKISRIDVRSYLRERFRKDVHELLTSLSIPEIVVTIGKTLAYSISLLVEKWRLQDKRLIVFVDEVKKILDYMSLSPSALVTALYNGRGLRQELRLKNLTIVLMSSDQTAVMDFFRESGKCSIYLMWHLDYYSTRALCEQLNVNDPDKVWELTGGCPRDIVEIWRLGLERWLINKIRSLKCTILQLIMRLDKEKLVRELSKLVESTGTVEVDSTLYELLLVNNIIIQTLFPGEFLSSRYTDQLKGKVWTWQVPIYEKIIQALLELSDLLADDKLVLGKILKS